MPPVDRACDLREGVTTFVWRGDEKEKVTLRGRCGHRVSDRRSLGFRTGGEVWGDGEIDGRGGQG